MRIVLDTNVVVSGLITPGGSPPGRLFDAVSEGRVAWVVSPPLLDELADVPARRRLQPYRGPGVAEVFLATIDAVARVASDPLPAVTASADPADNAVPATAVAGSADLVVSGDKKHLSPLKSYEGVPS